MRTPPAPLLPGLLARKLAAYIILFSSIIALCITVTELTYEYHRDLREIDGRVSQIKSSYLAAITENVWVYDKERIHTLLRGITSQPDIVLAEIHINGKTEMRVGENLRGEGIERIFPLQRQHQGQMQNIGELVVAASYEDAYQRALEHLMFSLVSNGLKTFLVAIFIFTLYYRLIGAHLNKIAGYAKAHAHADDASALVLERASSSKKDELSDLVEAINHMRRELVTLTQVQQRRYETLDEQTQASQRIAAIAFECQEGMIITDADRRILRTNKSFTRIMGYTQEEVVGKTTTFMRSDRHPASFYDAAWETGRREGVWNNEVWHRRKNGEVFQQWLTCTAVKDELGIITNYVVTHTDITLQKQQEAKRLADETTHRDALVREVHHRIKNNLQGITGLLRQFAQENPQTAEAINQAKSQIRSIAVLHGLQGHASMDTVRLCELVRAIAADVQSVWQTPINVDIPSLWTPGIIAEKEAVPIALVLNELLVNAVKHGGKVHGHVSVTLRKGADPETIQVAIRNSGHLRANTDRPAVRHAGLQLVAALMPREGARLTREQNGSEVLTQLEISPPVVHLEVAPA